MKKEFLALNYIFYFISFYVLLPNRIKEVPFALLGLVSIIIFIREKKIDLKLFSLVMLFFAINLLSLIYTKNISYGFHRIEGLLPFLYLGFAFSVFSKMELRIEKKVVYNWILLFNTCNFIFLIIVFNYFYFNSIPVSYNSIRKVFDEIPIINMHPIYLSITAVLGFLSCTYIFKEHIKKSIFLILINISLLFLTGTRSAFLGFLIVLVLGLFIGKFASKFKWIIGVSGCLVVFMLFMFNSDFSKRFLEISASNTYSKVNLDNSTSIRVAVWDCSVQQIKKSNLIIGNGIGDIPSVLQQCYDDQFDGFDKYYNSHNQYFSILLGSGIVGLMSFLIFFILHLISAFKAKNNLLFLVIFFYLFMFNFENILERKYGILLMCFSMFFVFNIFIKHEETVLKSA